MEAPGARRALLAGLIDHAPTFPPAELPLDEALAEDERAIASEHSWVLARLVWPASRLGEIAGSGRAVSAVLDEPLPPGAAVAAVEVRFPDELEELGAIASEVYVEVPLDHALEARLDALADRGFRAKVRCGGADVPTADDLARFVRACRRRGVVFKATAGLHHAVRSNGGHGFLNLLAAAVFEGEEEAALEETDPASFALDDSAFSWRERSAGEDELARVRRAVLHSIGSCSFFEPIEELESLGMLAS
jgi:hypothetical protein